LRVDTRSIQPRPERRLVSAQAALPRRCVKFTEPMAFAGGREGHHHRHRRSVAAGRPLAASTVSPAAASRAADVWGDTGRSSSGRWLDSPSSAASPSATSDEPTSPRLHDARRNSHRLALHRAMVLLDALSAGHELERPERHCRGTRKSAHCRYSLPVQSKN
jgi:hypothetical protein